MPIDVVMPGLSDTMEEGVLVRWLKQPGDPVHKGDAVAEVETDKATMELEAFDEGTLSEILVQEGESVPVGTPVARLTAPGEKQAVQPESAGPKAEEAPPRQEGEVNGEYRRLAHLQDSIKEHPLTDEKALTPSQRRKKRQAEAGEPSAPPARESAEGERIKASPRARKLAETHGIDLSALQGSGPEGRVVEADVQKIITAKTQLKVEEPEPSREEGRELSRMRETIARRMTQSKQQAPHFYVTVSVRADQLVHVRDGLKRRFEVSYNDFILRACALALRRHPRLNASFQDNRLVTHDAVNIAQAVAVPDGLITPVLHDADQLSLEEIAEQSAGLIARVRGGHLREADMNGGTFTVSNMGMLGVEDFIAIINPPQAAILAVGAIQDVPVVENGAVIPGHRLKLTLSADHRVVNGVEAAEFLGTVQHFLENPVLLSEPSVTLK